MLVLHREFSAKLAAVWKGQIDWAAVEEETPRRLHAAVLIKRLHGGSRLPFVVRFIHPCMNQSSKSSRRFSMPFHSIPFHESEIFGKCLPAC